MCGIAGHLSFEQPPADLHGMLDILAHRGPDDIGLHENSCVRLGFRRLAIVDLSEAGHQPMCNEDGSIWIVFNGEIYNYRELTAELRTRGHRFRSQTDTETILHGYEEWGVACLERLNGMFSLALWDVRQQRLFCARDRFGVKPFYYTTPARGELLFASEIKALFQHSRAPQRAANDAMIFDFLTSGLLDHTSQTCFAEVYQLPAAHYLLATKSGHTLHRYWDIPDQAHDPCAQPTSGDRRRWATEFAALLEDSVRLRLHADVPVGTCLSGGLDSSAIVCLANRLLFADGPELPWHRRGERQKTFSACYSDQRHDERTYIEQVLAATGAETNLTFPGEELPLESVIPTVIWHQDEPFGSTSILAQWHVMRAAARRDITVLLDGQGADELLGGYHGYFGSVLADDARAWQMRRLIRDIQLMRRYHHPDGRALARGALVGLVPPGSAARRLARAIVRPRHAAPSWLGPRFAADQQITNTWVPRATGHLQTMLYNQAMNSSLPGLLHYEDRNSMAFSIEARTPFLDYRLAEYLFQLPNAALIQDGVTKSILRNAMKGILPEPVRTRLDKKGFSTPEDAWFRTSLRTWAADILQSPSMASRGYTKPEAARQLLDGLVAGTSSDSVFLWRVLNLELWARMFLDQAPAPPPSPVALRRAPVMRYGR